MINLLIINGFHIILVPPNEEKDYNYAEGASYYFGHEVHIAFRIL